MSEPQPREELFAAIDKHATELQWSSDGCTYHATIADVEIVAFPGGGCFAARVQALGCSDDNTARIERIVTAAQTQIVQRMLDAMAGEESEPEPENEPTTDQIRRVRASLYANTPLSAVEEDRMFWLVDRGALTRETGVRDTDTPEVYAALRDARLVRGDSDNYWATDLGVIIGSSDMFTDECKAAVKRYGENQ